MSTVTDSPSESLETRRITVFLFVAFGFAGLTALVVFSLGGLTDSPAVLPGVPLWLVLVSTFYMFSPSVANVVTRAVTDEGWSDLRLRPAIRSNGRTYLLAWLAPLGLSVAGVALFFAFFPAYFDADMTVLRRFLPSGAPIEAVLAAQLVQALVLGATVNAVFAFGEEFGWRGYLLQKLLPLGRWRAIVGLGVIWGAWHWPLISLGYNYGFSYVGAPWTGFLAMVWMTTATGTFLAWVALCAESVWPAAVAHGVINAVGSLGVLFSTPETPALLGPTVVGAVVVIPWTVVAVVLLLRSPVFDAEWSG